MATIRYILRDAFRLLCRHWGLTILTWVTMMAVFLAVGGSFLLTSCAHAVVAKLAGDLTIEAYLTKGFDLEALKPKIEAIPHVKEVTLVTPESALARLKELLGEQAQVVELLGENPLPPSLVLQVDDASNADAVAQTLRSLPEIEDVVYAREAANRLARLNAVIRQLTIGIIAVAIMIGILILFNTVRIAVYSRREELAVMLKVGATPTYVAMPFLLQGVILGGLGGISATLILTRAYTVFVKHINRLLPFLMVPEGGPEIFIRLVLLLVGGGMALGWICSWIATSRHIRDALRPL